MTTAVDPPRAASAAGRPPAKRVVTRSAADETTSSGTRTSHDDPGDRGSRANGVRQGGGVNRFLLILAVLGMVGTVGFGLAWAGARGDDGGTGATATSGSAGDLLKAARSFSTALTNFDGATIDRDFDRITAKATGQFRSQADQFFSTDVRAQLKKAQASSRGEIRSAFVQTAKDDRGTVFVVVDQTIANNQSPQPQADTLRMELGLVLKGDTWKVERVSVLTAPAGGATGSSSGSGGSSGGGSGGSGSSSSGSGGN